jgi:hypothetical protein
MYINNYLSLQKRYFPIKKSSDTYFHDLADFILLLGENQGPYSSQENYYSSTRDELDFFLPELFLRYAKPIDLGFTNIIKPR